MRRINNVNELFDKIAAQEKAFRSREFIAPYTPALKEAVVSMSGMLYKFKIANCSGSGIGRFQPQDAFSAKWVDDAPYESQRKYFDALPRLYLILCFQTEEGWVAYPFKKETALKKFGITGEAVILNVSDCQRFDVVVARFDGLNFWYDEIFAGSDPIKADEMRHLFEQRISSKQKSVDLNQIKKLTEEDKEAFSLASFSWDLFVKSSTESTIQELLENGGAVLGSYIFRGKNIEIRWQSPSGENYVSIVNKDTLDVVSAGICLAGEDEKFHLKDLPFIMEQGEKRGLIHRTHRNRNLLYNDDIWDDDD